MTAYNVVHLDGTPVQLGDTVYTQGGDPLIYRGVLDPPNPDAYSGPFPGRVIVEDADGNRRQVYVMEPGLRFEEV